MHINARILLMAIVMAGACYVQLTGAGSAEVNKEKTTVWNLWDGTPPGEKEPSVKEKYLENIGPQMRFKRLSNVSVPTLTVYHPLADKHVGTAIIVAPGGGYSILAIEHEGTQVCEWLRSLGITAVLLKYRVPKRPGQNPDNLAMVQDAQRAVSVLRSRSAELGIDPQRIGMIGFSAGGHLTACTCLADQRYYDPRDRHDGVRGTPDFALLIYPAWLVDKDGRLSPQFVPKKSCPPMFFVHTWDDPFTCESSVALFLALKKQGVSAELHVYARGGHGYGMLKVPYPCATWPDRAAEWMKSQGYLDTGSKHR